MVTVVRPLVRLFVWNVVVLFISFGLLEGGFRIRAHYTQPKPFVTRQYWKVLDSFGPENSVFKKSFASVTGATNLGGTLRSHSAFLGTTKVFEQEYLYDAYGLRSESHRHRGSERKKFLGLLGCSFVFGIGVSDDQTLSAYLSEEIPSREVHNWGIGGLGPNSILRMLEVLPLNQMTSKETGDVMLVFADFHLLRILASSSFLVWGSGRVPIFELNDENELKLIGPFESSFRLEFLARKGLAWLSTRSELFRSAALPLAVYEKPKNWKLTAAIISEVKSKIEVAFPRAHFTVLFYPGETQFARRYLEPQLREKGIDVFSPTHLPADFYTEVYRIRGDSHPSPIANKALAKSIAIRLSERENRASNQIDLQ